MSNDFQCDAPTFFDFISHFEGENTANIESYFDTDHEYNEEVIKYKKEINTKEQLVEQVFEGNPPSVINHEHIQGNKCEYEVEVIEEVAEQIQEGAGHEHNQQVMLREEVKDQFIEQAFTIEENATEVSNKIQRMPRRSLSTGNLFCVNNQNVIVTNKSAYVKKLNSSTKLYRSASRNSIYNLAKPKNINTHVSKFISMAEAVNKFYNKTPERFHTKTRDTQYVLKKNFNTTTIPQSPNLMTKQRARTKHVLSQKELEEKELEEARKFKIKALPLNPKVLQGPVKPVHVKKPNTVVEPFNLTECTAKLNIKSPEAFEFHAKPVPKSIYGTPRNVPQMKKHSGVDETKKQQVADNDGAVKHFALTKTQPVPFSFEQRNKQIIKKKEEFINKVLEEEKKAREFHAKPPPKYLNSKRQSSSTMSVKSSKSEEDFNFAMPTFKARPPTVLYKKPFEPKKMETTLIEITKFELNTERRARDRQNFENDIKKKEENIAELKKQAEERHEEYERRQRAELRKKAEYKANPIRHYKAVQILPSQKITEPISPVLHTAEKKNKENAQ